MPLLIHDETLERTTNGNGRVADLTADEIRRFDAGGPHHPAFAVSPAPTFAEALAECARLGLWANIEIKPASGHDHATGSTVARLLDAAVRAGNAPRSVLSSFSEIALHAAYTTAPALQRALLLERLPQDIVGDIPARLRATGATALHLEAQELLDAPERCAALRGLGVPLAAYTVNHREQAEQLFAAGVRAIFTDRPDRWQAHEM
jgi:glycerophosphoryl diester phosphodiesterase